MIFGFNGAWPFQEEERVSMQGAEGTGGFQPQNMQYPSLATSMNVSLVVNEHGQIWILHDKQFPCVLHWVEYDAGEARLVLVSHDGFTIDLGMTVQKAMHQRMKGATHISTMLVGEASIEDFYILPLISR